MYGKSIGIILSKRDWKWLAKKQTANIIDSIFFQYAKKGEELGIEVLFFNIEQLLLHELTGNAFVIKENQIIEIGSVRIPSIIYNSSDNSQKKYSKWINELTHQPGIYLINERNTVKKKHFFEIIESHIELRNYFQKDYQHHDSRLIYHVCGQKDRSGQWNIRTLYAKDSEERMYTFSEANSIANSNHEMDEKINRKIYKLSQKLCSLLHHYFPEVVEIGLQFLVIDHSEIRFLSTCSITNIIKDLCKWNVDLLRELLIWPIEQAELLFLNNTEEKNEDLSAEISETDQIKKGLWESNRNSVQFWVKFKSFQDENVAFILPDRMGAELKSLPNTIQFGMKKIPCQFVLYEDAIPLKNNSFYFPVTLFVSQKLVEKMHLSLDLVYQIQFSDEKAIIGPTIGFLLGEKNNKYSLNYMEKYNDRFGEYDKFGGLTIAFSPRSIDWEEKIVYGMVYDPEKKNWRYDSAPIPSTIYRRNFHQNEERIQKLVEFTENNVFNSFHFTKSNLVSLKNKPEIKNHLPTTYLLNDVGELIDFINIKQKVILKPVSLSRGRGIFILERNLDYGYKLTDYRNNDKVHYFLNDKEEIRSKLLELEILTQAYLYQTYIPLLKVNGRSFDVRVVMQKYNRMKWKCSGIECRVARENEDLTNIARGGVAMTLEETIKKSALNLPFANVQRSIINLCQRFCLLMDKSEEHFAEFGLDIALDEEGYPWLLEANIYPSFKGFKELDYDTYLRIRYQPLFYAVQIQGFTILDDQSIGIGVNFNRKTYF